MEIKQILWDRKKCIFCGHCQQSCPFDALLVEENEVLYRPNRCHLDCKACSLACPESAIEYGWLGCSGCKDDCTHCAGCSGKERNMDSKQNFNRLKKFTIFAGNYGSGKTELSLNAALYQASQGKETMLVDLDIVNPYFRSSEHQALLEEKGIRVIKPCFANTMVDVPSLPAEIFAPFDSPVDFAVFDAGGDPVGAAALGQLAPRFEEVKEDTAFLYVLNSMRPLQETAEEMIEMLLQIQAASKMTISGLVNNANLARDTTAEMIEAGQALAEEVSRQTGIPLQFTSHLEELELEGVETPKLPLTLFTRPDWLDFA